MPTDLLPTNVDAERFVLGSVQLDDSFYPDVVAVLTPDDFSLEKHRRIFRRMGDLAGRGEHIDRITVATELQKHGELESCDGLAYLVSLDDGLPQVPNIDSYVRIVERLSVRRRGILTFQHMTNRLQTMSEDETETLVDAERMIALLADERDKHRQQWQTPGDVIAAYPGGLQGLVCPPRGGSGIPTPWKGLTEGLTGLHPEELVVLAGRPGMGKSLIGMALCYHAATIGHGAAVFSLEMANDALTTRLIASVARIDALKMRAGYLGPDERRRVLTAADEVAVLPLWMVDDTGARTVPAMTAVLRRLASEGKVPKLIMIDYVQLMVGVNRKHQDRRLELEGISNALKRLARETKTTVILLSQLNRDCEKENRRPQLSDLRECGALEQDADVVLFIHRPEAYAKNYGRAELKGLAELIVAKQRSGPTGKRDLIFFAGQQRFEERTADGRGEPLGELDDE